MKTLSLAQAKAKLSGLIDEVTQRDERVTITKRGRPAAVLMSHDEAASAVDRWDQQYQQTKGQTKEKAREVGQAAASGVAKGAWASFAILILSAIAAAYGGLIGTRGLSYIRPQAPAAT